MRAKRNIRVHADENVAETTGVVFMPIEEVSLLPFVRTGASKLHAELHW